MYQHQFQKSINFTVLYQPLGSLCYPMLISSLIYTRTKKLAGAFYNCPDNPDIYKRRKKINNIVESCDLADPIHLRTDAPVYVWCNTQALREKNTRALSWLLNSWIPVLVRRHIEQQKKNLATYMGMFIFLSDRITWLFDINFLYLYAQKWNKFWIIIGFSKLYHRN